MAQLLIESTINAELAARGFTRTGRKRGSAHEFQKDGKVVGFFTAHSASAELLGKGGAA